MLPPMTSDTSLERVVTTQPPTVSSVEKGLPRVKWLSSGEVAGEAKQIVRNVEFVLASTSSVAQDPETTQSSVP